MITTRLSLQITLSLIAILITQHFQLTAPYFFLFALPQVFRKTFEILINPMAMREVRIILGPPAALLILLSGWNKLFLWKTVVLLIGVYYVPRKDEKYVERRRKHGIAMQLVFAMELLEVWMWKDEYRSILFSSVF